MGVWENSMFKIIKMKGMIGRLMYKDNGKNRYKRAYIMLDLEEYQKEIKSKIKEIWEQYSLKGEAAYLELRYRTVPISGDLDGCAKDSYIVSEGRLQPLIWKHKDGYALKYDAEVDKAEEKVPSKELENNVSEFY